MKSVLHDNANEFERSKNPTMSQLQSLIARVVPVLEYSLHKGQCGRVLIVGGCEQYTGAPYYAAMAALRAGADLVTVVCTPEAALPIKSYSPDLMVHGCLKEDEKQPDTSWAKPVNRTEAPWAKHVDRADVLVIGSGLGLESLPVLLVAEQIIERAIQKEKKIVLDADMLTRLQKVPELIRGYPRTILTPNAMEFRRLWTAYASSIPAPPFDAFSAPNNALEILQGDVGSFDQVSQDTCYISKQIGGGVTILRKGAIDIISDGSAVAHVGISSSPRRVGGQGDILAGLTGLCYAWTDNLKNSSSSFSIPPSVLAASLASFITRQATARAFQKKKRSMLTSDVLEEIVNVLEEDLATDLSKL
eukprot:TRINITY_DN24220_c0_g1_i1.p1 TRINITY_DN24220_c0_g1~~TRINITY_DN24220_c0_g1_i1.p1  ORF type:complete len:361 (-),score=89.93 TRINITY_DN24220_c0_g1_i1:134-1216(-)